MFTWRNVNYGRKLISFLLSLILGLCVLHALPAMAGGLIAYEIGTADVGLASAGFNVRAQDASTVFTNPAGMTRLDGAQVMGSGQVDYGNMEFSVKSGTSQGLGTENGGRSFGSDGWFLGGGGFFSYSLSPDLKVGFAMTGNFGAPVKYDDNWAGRYYAQEATLVGLSFVPAIAYKVTNKLSIGGSVTAMDGIYRNQVAINNADPRYGDGQLKLDDNAWGWGFNLGLLYEFTPDTRVGFTWNSQVNLDFRAPAEFSNLAPGLNTKLTEKGLTDANIDVGIAVPQQLMGSIFSQVSERWAVLGSVGWQQWSKFGQVQLGVQNTLDPTSLTQDLELQGHMAFCRRRAISAERTVAAQLRRRLRYGISGRLQGFPAAAGERGVAVWRGRPAPVQQDLHVGCCGRVSLRRDPGYERAKPASGGVGFAW